MAPVRPGRNEGLSNRPFADYFWVAGLDGEELFDVYRSQTSSLDGCVTHEATVDRRRSAPIPEETLVEETDTSSLLESPTNEKQNGRPDSYDRLSNLSDDARRSIQSIDGIAKLRSNRSSATIKPAATPTARSPSVRMSTVLSEADFNDALKKFALDRETFLSLDLRAENAPKSPPPKSRSKTQRIMPEDVDAPLSRTLGSVRRHMSFREMNSTRRQPPMVRKVSTRTSRRISTYNSVIPQPEHIQSIPNQHPLRKTFEPALLDCYPRSDMINELQRRDAFPDYVPMFAFPNDIQVIPSDTRPPTQWHEFSMTAADNSKIPAICVVVWIPMSRRTADELEKLCEQWRRANLTDAEREMAVSLAERLAIERAKLSVLLSKLPQATQGSSKRDELEEEISAVEEKINLMSDMLRPLRHGAANRIEGLTDGDTGLWIPRAYGILGKDESMTAVWKEWLRAVVVPMMDGAILRVPPSSPRVGMWQPLERYVFNICCEAQSPASSKVQVELAVRELRLYAKKEAPNELPGSRSTDLYPLFRALTIPNIVMLFEYMLAETRIIIVSSHVAMLKLVTKALLQLLWPFEWAGVYIPVVPARLTQVLEAPCPYICGVVRKGEKLTLPEDDFVMVDLDKNELHATEQPISMPKQQRRKLLSLLYLAAPHHHSRGVPIGPPATAMQAFPNNAFSSEHKSIFAPAAPSCNLAKLAGLSSSMFGQQAVTNQIRQLPILNAFLHFSPSVKGIDRPMTATTVRQPSQPGSDSVSPSGSSTANATQNAMSRSDSGFALQASLKEKRSGHFDSFSRSGDTFSNMRRKASLPFVKHGPSPSTASISPGAMSNAMSMSMSEGASLYSPSSYAQSTIAASTIIPGMTFQPVRNTESQIWVEGHSLVWQVSASQNGLCAVCDEKIDGNYYRCSGCSIVCHAPCTAFQQIPTVCPAAFFPDQIRAAFARFFASLLYEHRKFIGPAQTQLENGNHQPRRQKVDNGTGARTGLTCRINVDAWFRTLSPEHATYMEMLKQTQMFNEFVAEREQLGAGMASGNRTSDSIKLFDALLMAKRGRSGRMRSGIGIGMSSIGSISKGRNPFIRSTSSGSASASNFGFGAAQVDFLSDTSTHTWRLVSFAIGAEKPDTKSGSGEDERDYHTIVTRTPAKLEEAFLANASKAAERKRRGGAFAAGKDEVDELIHLKHRMNGLSMNAP